MSTVTSLSRCSPNPAEIGYSFLRHVGLILDELSSQGLELWVDEAGKWYWRWHGTSFVAARGFWALGEAIVDAVINRYPAHFSTTEEQFDE